MKKILLALLILTLGLATKAQIIVTNPAIVTNDYNGIVEVIYDASKGNAGLKDFTGTEIYAHTGVITTASTSNTDWKHASTWGNNATKYKLSSQGNNKWKFLITPNMKYYYALTTGEVVSKIAFVFRDATGAKQGKDTGGGDIFVNVLEPGLNVAFTNPTSNQRVNVGTSMEISFTSTLSANLKLIVNNAEIASAGSTTTLTKNYTFATSNDYMLVASATSGSVTVYDTVYILVPNPLVDQARPSGIQNGVTYNSATSATFVLHAPGKSNVSLIGEFNDWTQLNSFQMKRDGEYWWLNVDGLTPGKLYGYQYLVDDELRISDPYTDLVLDPWNDQWINNDRMRFPNLKTYPSGKTTGLVATMQTNKQPYNWEVPNFTMPNRENMVIYELLIRDFTIEKTLEAAISKLDYLRSLGITAVELMPIHEFDGNESWGYNPNHFFAPDKFYGSPEMYKSFVDECHKRGIAVIIDVVFNHATGINPMAALYWNAATSETSAANPWFNVSAPHPYSVFHDFNHEYQGTRDYFKRVLRYWIQEYKVDGYRLDLTKGFTQKASTEATASNYDQSRINILTDYYQAAKSAKDDVMFILEHFCNYDEELELANRGMYLWRNVNNSFSQSAMGFVSNSDFGSMNSNPRKWVGFAESHDEERNFYKAKDFGSGMVKTDSLYRISRVPLNVAFSTLIPGPKMLWQFQEMGYDYSIDALGGRTSNKPSAWGWLNLAHRKAAYEASAKIITIRKMFPTAFTQGNFTLNIGTGDWENGRRIALTHADLNLVVLGNFKDNNSITAFPNFPKTGSWYNVLTGEIYYVGSVNSPIDIPAGQVRIYADRKIDFDTAVDKVQSDGFAEKLYPTYTTGKVFITDSAPHAVSVYNMQGQLLKLEKNTNEFDLSAFPAGIYLVKLDSFGGSYTGKVIKN